MKTIALGKRGFTLMEVALALVIIAIVLVSLVSMLGMALDSDRSAERDTALAAMSSQVLSRLRAVPFDALWQGDPSATPVPQPSTAATAPDTTYYFSDAGTLLATGSTAPAETLFRCVVKKVPDALSRAGTGPYHRLAIRLEFTWPVSAATPAAARPNLRILHASIARY